MATTYNADHRPISRRSKGRMNLGLATNKVPLTAPGSLNRRLLLLARRRQPPAIINAAHLVAVSQQALLVFVVLALQHAFACLFTIEN